MFKNIQSADWRKTKVTEECCVILRYRTRELESINQSINLFSIQLTKIHCSVFCRRHIVDTRVHCCLYFISPFGHGLKPLGNKVSFNLGRIPSWKTKGNMHSVPSCGNDRNFWLSSALTLSEFVLRPYSRMTASILSRDDCFWNI